VMDAGRVVADDMASALKSTLAGDVITLGFGSGTDAAAVVTTVSRVARAEASVRRVRGGAQEVAPAEPGQPELEVTVQNGDAVLPLLLRELDASGTPAVTARLRQPTLDDVFLALTGRSLREEGTADREQSPGTSPTTAEKVPA